MSICSSCQAPIVWVYTTNGKPMPIDGEHMGGWTSPRTFPDGIVQPTDARRPDRTGTMTMVVAVRPGSTGGFRSHFVSCPHAEEHRR